MNKPFAIGEYSDKQAVDDGVLVPVLGKGRVNRAAAAVFDHFTKSPGSSPATGRVTTDNTRLQDAIRALLKVEPDQDTWRTGALRREGSLADSE
jgi:hypothetical protein